MHFGNKLMCRYTMEYVSTCKGIAFKAKLGNLYFAFFQVFPYDVPARPKLVPGQLKITLFCITYCVL